MRARGELNRAVITAMEAQQKRPHGKGPARGAVNLLGPNEQLVPVGVDDHDGIAIEQGSGSHLAALVGIIGRDEVRPEKDRESVAPVLCPNASLGLRKPSSPVGSKGSSRLCR
jgi:hypothetical protein